MQPSSIKTSIGRFSQQLKSFSQQTADGVGELKRHINSKPSAGPGQFRECLQDLLIEPASEIEEEVAALEGVTLDAVSLEELVGHCLAVYEENKRHIKDMEAHLAQYGYTSGFVADEAIADPRERLAQGPVAMPSAEPSGESALPTDEDADQENDPACAAQRTALKGQKPQACTAIKAQPLGQLTNLPYERQPSQSPAMSIEFPDVADALQDKYREQSLSRQPTVTPSPNVSSSSASAISFSPSLRELQRKYGKAQSRDSLDSVNAPLASDPSQGPSPAVGPALAGAVAEPASGGRQAAADGRTRIGQLAMDMANLRTSSIAASPLGRLNLRVPETPSSPQTIIPPTPLRDILEVLEQQNVAGQECESEPSENSQPGTPSGEALANAGVWDAAGNPLNPKGSASKKGRKREALAGRSHSGEAPWDMLSLKAAIVAAKVGTGQVQQAILSTTFHPQAAAFTSLFHMCAKQKLWQKALEIFEAMKARPHHVRPNTVHFSSLISACGTAGRWQEALQVFQEMKAAAMQDGGALPNVITYSALMTACCAGGRPDMAYEVFCEMKAAGIRPDAISFSTLIAGFERHGDMARAVQIHAEMCRSGLDQGMPPGGKLPIYLEQFGRKLGLLTNQGALAQQQSPWLGPASPHSHVILEGGIGEPAGPEEFQCHVSDAGGYGGEDSTLDLRANMIRENMGRSPAPGPYHSAYGPSPMAHAGLHTPTPRSYAAKPGTPSTAELLKAAHSGSSAHLRLARQGHFPSPFVTANPNPSCVPSHGMLHGQPGMRPNPNQGYNLPGQPPLPSGGHHGYGNLSAHQGFGGQPEQFGAAGELAGTFMSAGNDGQYGFASHQLPSSYPPQSAIGGMQYMSQYTQVLQASSCQGSFVQLGPLQQADMHPTQNSFPSNSFGHPSSGQAGLRATHPQGQQPPPNSAAHTANVPSTQLEHRVLPAAAPLIAGSAGFSFFGPPAPPPPRQDAEHGQPCAPAGTACPAHHGQRSQQAPAGSAFAYALHPTAAQPPEPQCNGASEGTATDAAGHIAGQQPCSEQQTEGVQLQQQHSSVQAAAMAVPGHPSLATATGCDARLPACDSTSGCLLSSASASEAAPPASAPAAAAAALPRDQEHSMPSAQSGQSGVAPGDLCPQAQQLDQEEYKKLPLRFSRQLALDQINQAVGYINTAIAAKHAEHGAPPGDAGHGITAAELESLHLGHLKTSALLNCLMSVNRLRGVTTQGNFAYHIVRQPACLPV